METGIQGKIEKRGMIISRIPEWAKEVIKTTAESEHSDDYGACIAQFIRDANEYRILKDKFFNNDMNVKLILDGPSKQIEEPEKEDNCIKFANGKKLNNNGGKNNGYK